MPAPLASLSEASVDESDVSVVALSRAGFADDDAPVLASAPAIDPITPAELVAQAARVEPRLAPETETPDSVAHAVNPPEADRDEEADQDSHDDRHAPDRAEPETAFAAAPPPDLVPAAMLHAAEPAPLNRFAFAPDRIDMIEIGSTIARYMQGEGTAALEHFRALSDVRTPADLIRLQVGEAQRAADASLTCWVTVMGKASRVVAFR
ncbi:hypothetical protein MKK63_27970 [Methylobacterium sp. J-088]|uniref:hypothetical protein n=1 Tax=Methylobacterium sp. J-088 TaxID=2836664 RepID=UPI001FB9EEFC|nr:hypothetical protein [Methylobacterium sp. J-088]MCJ2066502.1 hypothetical protein [Methylobacterium sp. J-088]